MTLIYVNFLLIILVSLNVIMTVNHRIDKIDIKGKIKNIYIYFPRHHVNAILLERQRSDGIHPPPI